MEAILGIGVDSELDGISFANGTDVGLIDLGLDLDAAQILRDLEELGRLQARSDRLADIDSTRDHGAVDRRLNERAIEIDFGDLQRGFALRDRRLRVRDLGIDHGNIGRRHIHIADGAVERRGRGDTLCCQCLLAFQQTLGVAQDGLGSCARSFLIGQASLSRHEIGASLGNTGGECLVVEAGEKVAFLDLAVEVGAELVDPARKLRTNADGDNGTHGA